MKTFKFFILIFIFLGCKKSPPETIDEVPAQITLSGTCSSLYSRFLEILPSGQSNRTNQPYFFSDTTLKTIVVSAKTKVFLTIINENAHAFNSIGWYTYKEANKPVKKSDIKRHILFPNASLVGSGGKLVAGNTIQLDTGKFAAGTVIGFYLVVNGWQNDNVDESQPILFTDYLLNNKQDQQHVLYYDKACQAIVLSWEDTPLYMTSDSDFNDLVFTVSDNINGLKPKSFKVKGIVIK